MHLLVIEDERALCETIVRSLRRLAYSVDYCYDGEKALALLGVERYDLVLLDLNLPKKDGMTVLRTLRQTDRETRVLILSARSEVEDKVQGLDAGANDYLAKPFHLAELEARIRSLTLRQFTQQDVLLSCGGLTFDTRSRTAAVNGQTLTLTRKETGILEYLMVHQVSWMCRLMVQALVILICHLTQHGSTLKGTMSMIKPLMVQVHVFVLMRHVFSSRISN
mgnify:FL=1